MADLIQYDDKPSRISDHINTWNPALRIIKSKGFKIFIYPVSDYRIFLGRIFPKEVIPPKVTRETFFTFLSNWYTWDIDNFYEWKTPAK